MNSKTKFLVKKFFKNDLWQYALILSIICVISCVFDKWIEAICFCITHCMLRPKFNKQYHSNTTSMCLLITIAISFLGITSTLSTNISLLSSIPISLIICWVGFIVQDRIDLDINNNLQNETIMKYQDKINKLEKQKLFDLDNCTEDELRERCRLKFLHNWEYKFERCKKHFIDKLPHEQIDISIKQSQMERYRFRKILK